MDRKSLKKILLESNIPNDLYALDGGLPNEAFCMDFVDDMWIVYYSERGVRTQIGHFKEEGEACECLFKEIKKIFPELSR